MLSDNIRNYRKKYNMSQDELAEKVGVSRQSVSFWETGQTSPTIDNIIALSKIFNVSSDVLLGNAEDTYMPINNRYDDKPKNKSKTLVVTISILSALVLIVGIVWLVIYFNNNSNNGGSKKNSNIVGISSKSDKEQFDLFTYCKNFAIENGQLNGDYCIYQQPSAKYGGYENEYFSITYWSDSDMVEFCLHCPLDETLSHNFYIRMRGGYNHQYEYLSSKYYRDTGESLRSASGYIDPAVFSDNYPISCDSYEGDLAGQDQFMEDTRIGICDLIKCLKQFVKVENMDCDFSVFEFVNF